MEFTADLVDFSKAVSISLYSDGVPEGEEGFVVLLGVLQEELDAADMGFVVVLNQVVLVRIQDGGEYLYDKYFLTITSMITATDSRLEILTKDEPLGQREELLQYAALPGEQVTVGVTVGMQTVIVEAGAEVLVNFNYFFRNASQLLSAGDPEQQVTATIRRRALDKSGRPLPGEGEVLSPSQGRVSVTVDGVFEQYYVRIGDAAVTDSGVYTMEVCSQRGLPGEECVNASATLFVLDGQFSYIKSHNFQLVYCSWWFYYTHTSHH